MKINEVVYDWDALIQLIWTKRFREDNPFYTEETKKGKRTTLIQKVFEQNFLWHERALITVPVALLAKITLVNLVFQYPNILLFFIFKWDRMESEYILCVWHGKKWNKQTEPHRIRTRRNSIPKIFNVSFSCHWTGKTIFFISLILYFFLCIFLTLYWLYYYFYYYKFGIKEMRLGILFSNFHQFFFNVFFKSF